MSDFLLDQASQLPKNLKAEDLALYETVEIDLSEERTDFPLHEYFSGAKDFFAIMSPVNQGDCELKINQKNAKPLDCFEVRSITTIIKRLYLNNKARPGKKLKLLLGGDLAGSTNFTASTSFSVGSENVSITSTVGLKKSDLSFTGGNLDININNEGIGLITAIDNLNSTMTDVFNKLEENRLLLVQIEQNTATTASNTTA